MIPFTGRAQWADTAARRRAWLVASVLLAACELLVACDPLPPLPLESCGNHIVEPASGETCDGDQECVPRGEPNPCRMRCSAYPESRCPNGMICDQGACIARDHICGNLVVELGEECDGAPDCLPSGAPDACKLRCAAHDGGHCPIGSKCADSGACQPAPGACGNLVRDPGEDCDGPQDCLPPGGPDACKRPCGAYPGGECPIGSICGVGGACNMVAGVCGNRLIEPGEDCDGGTGCGKPSTSAACRFSCADGAWCPTGTACGRDLVCRAGNIYVGDVTITKASEVSQLSGVNVLQGSLFVRTSDLEQLILPDLQSISNYLWVNSTGLVEVRMIKLRSVGNTSICAGGGFIKVALPALTDAAGLSFGCSGNNPPPDRLGEIQLGALRSVTGDLSFSNTDMFALPFMSNLTSVGRSFQVVATSATVINLPDGLQRVGQLHVADNQKLARIYKQSFGRDCCAVVLHLDRLSVVNDPQLVALDFDYTVDDALTIEHAGMETLVVHTRADQISIVDNPALKHLSLALAQDTLSALQIQSNDALEEVADANYLRYVDKTLIDRNRNLKSLSLPFLDSVDTFAATDNRSLPTCRLKALMAQLRGVDPAKVDIHGNDDVAVCP